MDFQLKRRRETKLIGARFSTEDATAILDFCKIRGEHLSTLVRRAVFIELGRHSYLDPQKKKALGLEVR